MNRIEKGLEAGGVRQPPTDLMKIRSFMEQHFDEQLSVAQLAAMANISPKYFVDLFKKTYGQSAIEYLTDLRINRAKRYLCESEYRLREIAQKVGYSDEFYFSRKFKKEVGISPSAYVLHPRRRLAACSPSIIGQLLALNIVPIAAPLDSKWTPYYYNKYQLKIAVHMRYGEVQAQEELDKLMKARPDAIVGPGQSTDEQKQKLTSIAPTLFVAGGQVCWRDQLREIASFVGREKQAEAWLEGYDHKVAVARSLIQQAAFEDTFVVLRVYGQSIHAYCNHTIQSVLYHDLQLVSAYAQHSIYNDPLTLEQLTAIDPDRLLILVCPEAESRAYWLSLQHNQVWRTLKAVQRGYIYLVHSDPWCEYSAVAVDRMLDEMQLLLTGHCPSAVMDKVHGDSV